MAELPNELARRIEREVVCSPLGTLLGFSLAALSEDEAQVEMPYRETLTTLGDTVHGGAIAALADTAGTASVWANAAIDDKSWGATIGFTINFLAAARGKTLRATGRVRRRGREISTADISVRDSECREVAVALLTYKIGSSR